MPGREAATKAADARLVIAGQAFDSNGAKWNCGLRNGMIQNDMARKPPPDVET